jgi:hypothetical protein
VRPVPAVARRTAIAVSVALCVAAGWWWLRAPAVERVAVAPPPDIDIDPPAMRARRAAAIALAMMPDDPWTLAESLGASAPGQSAEPLRDKEDCGLDDAPQFAKDASADEGALQTRAAATGWLAAQARIDAALRASADPLDRMTADFINAGDVRTPDGVVDAVAEQAAASSDPRVFALGHEVCQKAWARSPACAALTAERWAQVDPGNGLPWVELLGAARTRGDEAATRDAMAHLAAATSFETRLYAPAGAVVDHLPVDGRDLAATGELVTRAIGQAAALPMPAFQPLIEACRNQAGGDPLRAGQCRAISDAMFAHSDAMIPFALSGTLLQQMTGDSARRDLIKAERSVAAAHWSPATGLAPCRDLREHLRQLDRKARIGEVEVMREEARKFVPP